MQSREQLDPLQFSPIESIALPFENPTERSLWDLSLEAKPLIRLCTLNQATEEQETESGALIDTLNKKRLYEFILEVNRDITELNQLIEQYHHAETIELKTIILQDINRRYTAMDARYPESVIRRSAEYRTRFYDRLATEIRINMEQIAELDARAPRPIYPDRLSELLEKMPQEKLNQFLAILCNRTNYDDDFEELYQPSDPAYPEFKAFLDTHSIQSTGGHNSNNFHIKRLKSSEPAYVLKIEDRINQPKDITQYLGSEVDNIIKPKWSRRAYCLRKERGGEETILVRSITTGPYFSEGSVYDYAMGCTGPQEKINSALGIYSQMATILDKISRAGGVFPDMKNSNWFIEHGRLWIGDDKSLRWQNEQRCIDVFSDRSQWYGDFLKSPEYMPPEVFGTDPISVDAFYAFSWGKNLYEFLVADPSRMDLAYQKKMSGECFNFNASVFRIDPEGPLLQQLITDLVRENPEDRISLQAGVARLAEIQIVHAVREHIYASIYAPLPPPVVSSYLDRILKLDPEQIKPYAHITPENLKAEMQPYLDFYKADYLAKFSATIQEIDKLLEKYPNEDLRRELVAVKMERHSLSEMNYDQFEADLGELLLAAEQIEMEAAAQYLDDSSEDEIESDDDNNNTLR